MRRVILESPYAAPTPEGVARNVAYARRCVRDSLARGEAPIASHLLYTQPGILDDNVPAERQQGIDAGLAWRVVAEATVVYVDWGISRGMQYGIDRARASGIPVEYRMFNAIVCIEGVTYSAKAGAGDLARLLNYPAKTGEGGG